MFLQKRNFQLNKHITIFKVKCGVDQFMARKAYFHPKSQRTHFLPSDLFQQVTKIEMMGMPINSLKPFKLHEIEQHCIDWSKDKYKLNDGQLASLNKKISDAQKLQFEHVTLDCIVYYFSLSNYMLFKTRLLK